MGGRSPPKHYLLISKPSHDKTWQSSQILISLFFSADGNSATVDILVCTPGRLVDHIDHTDGFSLEHLRFLIIDEADRLLGQAYHNWLEKIYKAAYRSKSDEITPRYLIEKVLTVRCYCRSSIYFSYFKGVFSQSLRLLKAKEYPLTICSE